MDEPTLPHEPTEILSPSEVAARLKIRERYLRKFARDTGHCRIFGNRMVFTPDDVTALLEASKPAPKVTHPGVVNAPGIRRTTPHRHPKTDFIKEALRLAEEAKRR